jgi:hypothetical protein
LIPVPPGRQPNARLFLPLFGRPLVNRITRLS